MRLFITFWPHSEMPTARERRAALAQLWASTADVMVIVERGTEPGFQLVLEARDYMLRYGTLLRERERDN